MNFIIYSTYLLLGRGTQLHIELINLYNFVPVMVGMMGIVAKIVEHKRTYKYTRTHEHTCCCFYTSNYGNKTHTQWYWNSFPSSPGGQWKADQKTTYLHIPELVLLRQDIFPSSIGILEVRKCSKFWEKMKFGTSKKLSPPQHRLGQPGLPITSSHIPSPSQTKILRQQMSLLFIVIALSFDHTLIDISAIGLH